MSIPRDLFGRDLHEENEDECQEVYGVNPDMIPKMNIYLVDTKHVNHDQCSGMVVYAQSEEEALKLFPAEGRKVECTLLATDAKMAFGPECRVILEDFLHG